jgi:hypothetical protein
MQSGLYREWDGCDTLLKGLTQHFAHMAAELGPCIQAEHAMVGQRHFARHRHVAATNQPHIRDGVMGGAKGAGRDQRRWSTSDGGSDELHSSSAGSNDACDGPPMTPLQLPSEP